MFDTTLQIIAFSLFMTIIALMILSFVVQSSFKKTNMEFSKIKNSYNKTGAQVANEILIKNNIRNVRVMISNKEGTDHYDPRTNNIMLSPSVYNSTSVSAAAIAAHEVGHAIQWGKQEVSIKIRDSLVKPVALVSKVGSTFMSIGFFFFIFSWGSAGLGAWFILGGIMAYGAATIFQFATLPVEFGASRKAKKQLESLGYLQSEQEIKGTKKVLNAAAMTYVIAALMSLVMLLYFILIFVLRRK